MVEDYWEYDSTYRGIEIQRWMPGAIAYGAWIDGNWVVRVSKLELKGLIDDWLGPEEPKPGWEYHSTYRGIEILVWMPGATYYSATFGDEWHIEELLPTLQAKIDSFLEPAVPNLKIENLTYPATANPGDTVNINWEVKNHGGNTTYTQWTRLVDEDTNEELYGRSLLLANNEYKSFPTTWTMPSEVWNLRIEAGFGTVLTASKHVRMGNGISPILPLLAVGAMALIALTRKKK